MTRIAQALVLFYRRKEEVRMQKSTSTHFEQIPVAAVKKRIEESPVGSQRENGRVTSPEKAMATSHLPAGLFCRRGLLKMDASMETDGLAAYPADLRELARRIQVENNSNTMIELVQQLIARFDERQLQRHPHRS
jgi:hypothetical protein